ncbi:MAG: hypothetical protein U0168_09415 [Nannocystaceae bacterium]
MTRPVVRGAFARELVHEVARARASELAGCLAADELAEQAAFELDFEINARGAVIDAWVAESDLSDAFDACVLEQVRWWRYPGPKPLQQFNVATRVHVRQGFIVVP